MAARKMELSTGLPYVNTVVAGLGMALSAYALHIEWKKHVNPSYEAYCDIGGKVKCSDVLSSPYSRGFGFVEPFLGKNHILNQPNPIFGIAFYALMIAVGAWNSPTGAALQMLLAVASVLQSFYLAYILYAKLHLACLVCISCYAVNAALLVIAWKKLQRLQNRSIPANLQVQSKTRASDKDKLEKSPKKKSPKKTQ